jgi:hypothetical protein
MFFFKTRKDAREFSKKKDSYKVVDCKDKGYRLRWAVKVL